MNLTLMNDYGCTEAVMEEYCGFESFQRTADMLADKFNITFTHKLHDSETTYWNFLFRGHKLTLHFNIFNGVSIFPEQCKSAAKKENDAVMDLARALTMM